MPVAERPQHLRALEMAEARRLEAARQRRELRGKPAREVIPALIDPTPELAAYKLATLFNSSKLSNSPIHRVGLDTVNAALREVQEQRPNGRRGFHLELRLRDLTRPERECLVRAIVKRAPKAWREAA